nr:hypothetical protein [Tanacetum cinerariifolium]
MRSHVKNFDEVVVVRTKVTGQNERTWGFEYIREAFEQDVKPFVKTLKEYFYIFDQDVMCIVMHADVEFKCVLPENDNHLGYAELGQNYIDLYSKVLELDAELLKKNDMVEKADTIREIVEQARALKPLDSDLYSACKFATQIQELLVYVSATCPSLSKQRVISFTRASGSKPSRNTRKNRISQSTSSKKQNKVEDHLISVKTSLNKKNRVSEPVCNANVKLSMLNVNSELICSTCNECMFDAIHDLCVIDFLNDVNVHVKSKSVKSKKKKNWKPTDDSIQEKLSVAPGSMWSNENREYQWEETLKAYYEDVGISHQTSVERTPQQNNVVERWIQTLVEAVSLIPNNTTGSHSLTFLNQDAPTASTSLTSTETQSLVISEGVEEQLQPIQFDNDPFYDILTSELSSQESSSNVKPANPPFEHLSRWTKNHLLDNVISIPFQPVSTRCQLQTDAM